MRCVRNEGLVSVVALTLLASGAACTKKNDQFADAGNSGGAADATSFDASLGSDAQAVGLVTVSVFASEVPAEGVVVFTNAANGDYLTSGTTDANGIVRFDSFPAGGTVTAAARAFGEFTTSTSSMLSSVSNVGLGETITFGRSRRGAYSTSGVPVAGRVDATLPGDFAGATLYEKGVPCQGNSSPVSSGTGITLYQDCIYLNGSVDVLAYASDLDGHLAYSHATVTNLSGKLDDLMGSVTMPDWQTDLGTYVVELSDSPQDELLVFKEFKGLVEGLPFSLPDQPPVQLQEGTSASLEVKLAPDFYEESVFLVGALLGNAAQNSESYVAFRDDNGPGAGLSVTKNLNLTSELPGLVSNIEVSDTNPLQVTWTNGSLACKDNPTPDALVVSVSGETNSGDLYEWVLLTPGDSASGVSLPKIDPGLAASLWPEASFISVEAGLVFKSDSSRTYEDLRTKANNLSLRDFVPAVSNSTTCLAVAGKQPR